MTCYATAVGEVLPGHTCTCKHTAAEHEVITDPTTIPDATQYYDGCTTQGCGCKLFQEPETKA